MCSALQAQGIEILIATTNADGSENMPVALGEKIVYQDIATIFFPRQWSEALKYSRPLALWLEQNVKNFDLVHIHAVFSHACVAAAAACRKTEFPTSCALWARSTLGASNKRACRKRLFWHLGVKQMLTGAAAHSLHHRRRETLSGDRIGSVQRRSGSGRDRSEFINRQTGTNGRRRPFGEPNRRSAIALMSWPFRAFTRKRDSSC